MSKLRGKLIGTRAKPGRLLKMTIEGEELEVEFRQPSQVVIAEVARRAGAVDGKVESANIARLAAELVVQCTFEPGSNERAFQEGDAEELLKLGPAVDELMVEALKALSPEGVKDLGNGSSATPS